MKEVLFNYGKSNESISDFKIKGIIEEINNLNVSSYAIFSNTINIFDALRVEHREGRIKLRVFFEGEELVIDEDARMPYWPDEMCLLDEYLSKLL